MVNTGVVVFDNSRIIHTETIKLSSEYDGVDKWMDLQTQCSREIYRLVDVHNPSVVVSEYPHGFQSATAARSLSTVSGVISGVCAARQIPVNFYTEYEVKRVLFGHSKGITKEQMMHRVLGIYEQFSYIPLVKGKPPKASSFQHISDALGVLAVYLKQHGLIN